MTRSTPVWTTDPLPDNVRVFTLAATCTVCRQQTITLTGRPDRIPETRSVDPDPDTGRYLVQPHERWCPVWTGQAPELPCPECGAPVHDYEYAPGYSLAVPDALFGVAHLVGTAEEIFGNPAARAVPFNTATLEPSLSTTSVSPCGHILKGAAALKVVTRGAELRAAAARAEADKVIADAQGLLSAAEAAGQPRLADAYRQAVRTRAATAPGLLAALNLLDTTVRNP